jgi:alkylation response protein AidB-like acyl-CoA dehydrogenase
MILVQAGTAGMAVCAKYSKVDWSASDMRELSFTDCRAPAASLLGRRGVLSARSMKGRVAFAALSAGLAQGCVDESLCYASERQALGAAIGK